MLLSEPVVPSISCHFTLSMSTPIYDVKMLNKQAFVQHLDMESSVGNDHGIDTEAGTSHKALSHDVSAMTSFLAM